jgi:hypothetical protein
MARRRKESDEEFVARILNKQFEINGHTDVSYESLSANREAENTMPPGQAWYQRYTTTSEKEKEYRDWLKAEMKQRYRYLRDRKLDQEVGMFLLNYGLKCDDCLPSYKQEEE